MADFPGMRGIPEPERVELEVDGVGTLGGRVTGIESGFASIVLDGEAASGWQLHGHDACLTHASSGLRIEGTLRASTDSRQVELVVHEPHRRSWTRADARLATLLVPDELGVLWRAETRNVAAGGMLVSGADELEHDQTLHVYVHLEDGDVDARGRVVRVDGPEVAAVAFEAISGPDRLRIHREVLRARIAELKDDQES
ncbi:MAG: PilZ domain-containing protein [Solirubrobacteraceae bacterium]|nr:PilZ domain-containing protein [Solirubrobacteraceae bacterium]